MALPEAVKGCKSSKILLNDVNMSKENEKLVRTTYGVLEYKHMKNTIMTIFGNPCGSEGNSNVDPLTIKQECFLGACRDRYQPNDMTKEEERKYGKGKPDRFKKTDHYEKLDRSDKNPMGHDGNILRCFRCNSTIQLASKCPQRANQYKSKDIN